MPKRSRTPKRPKSDPAESAFATLQHVISLTEGAEERSEKNPAAVALGRRGGLKGAKALNDSLSPSQRRESARNAAQARWAKKRR